MKSSFLSWFLFNCSQERHYNTTDEKNGKTQSNVDYLSKLGKSQAANDYGNNMGEESNKKSIEDGLSPSQYYFEIDVSLNCNKFNCFRVILKGNFLYSQHNGDRYYPKLNITMNKKYVYMLKTMNESAPFNFEKGDSAFLNTLLVAVFLERCWRKATQIGIVPIKVIHINPSVQNSK